MGSFQGTRVSQRSSYHIGVSDKILLSMYWKRTSRNIVGYLLIQICDSEGIGILKGVGNRDHVYIHIEYSPAKSISDIMKGSKMTLLSLLQQDYLSLKNSYWGRHFCVGGYGTWSTGNIADEMEWNIIVEKKRMILLTL